jgi:hypothetical protein
VPRAQQYADTSLSSRITAWLADNPGTPRGAAIAAGLGVPASYTEEPGKRPPKSRWTIDVGRELSRMYARGQVARQKAERKTAGGVRASTYSLPQQ